MIDRGQFYAQMGDYAAAEKILKEAREILESRQAANNPAMYFNCLMQLAALYSQTGRFDLAEPFFLENRQTAMENLGKEDPYAILSVSKLGMFYQSLGDMEKAEGLYQEHLELLEQTVGKDHEEYGRAWSTLANLYTEQGGIPWPGRSSCNPCPSWRRRSEGPFQLCHRDQQPGHPGIQSRQFPIG